MAIALVTSAQAGSSTGSNVTTSGVNTTGANLIVVAISSAKAGTVPVLSDSKGNTWTSVGAFSSTALASVSYFYCTNPTVGAGHTFTASSTAGLPLLTAFAFSGAGTVFSVYQSTAHATASATSNQASASFANVGDGCAFITGICSGGSSYNTPTGYTVTVSNFLAATHMGGGAGYKIQTTGSAESPTWSWTTATESTAFILGIRPPGRVLKYQCQDDVVGVGGEVVNDSGPLNIDGAFQVDNSNFFTTDGPGVLLLKAFDGAGMVNEGDSILVGTPAAFPGPFTISAFTNLNNPGNNNDFLCSDGSAWDSFINFTAESPPKLLISMDAGVNYRQFTLGSITGWHMLTLHRDTSNIITARVDGGNKISADSGGALAGTFTLAAVAIGDGAGLDGDFIIPYASDYEQTQAEVLADAAEGDLVAPTWTTSATQSIAENTTNVCQLVVDVGVVYSIVGGADQAKFSVFNGDELVFLVAPNYEVPTDADTNNVYVVVVRATNIIQDSLYTDRTFSVTVTDVVESSGPPVQASFNLRMGSHN